MFIRKYEENGKELPLPLLPWLNLFPVYNRFINYNRPTLLLFLLFCRLVQSLTLSVPGVRWMRFCGGVHLVRPEVRLARPPLHINIPCLHIYHFPHTTIHYKSPFLFYTDTGFSSCFLLWSFTKFHRGLINRSKTGVFTTSLYGDNQAILTRGHLQQWPGAQVVGDSGVFTPVVSAFFSSTISLRNYYGWLVGWLTF